MLGMKVNFFGQGRKVPSLIPIWHLLPWHCRNIAWKWCKKKTPTYFYTSRRLNDMLWRWKQIEAISLIITSWQVRPVIDSQGFTWVYIVSNQWTQSELWGMNMRGPGWFYIISKNLNFSSAYHRLRFICQCFSYQDRHASHVAYGVYSSG